MDYDALAKKYGGADAPAPVDYDALAKQYGGADIAALQPTGTLAPRQPTSALTQFGRSAASLADVTLGGVIPGAAQYLMPPMLRAAGRSPEQATASTQALVSAVDRPFGKTFGVAETPEYQQEASRQVMDFIGQNFQKGAKFISDKTGLPVGDVENMMASLTIAAPKIAPPVVRAVREVTAPVVQQIKTGAQLPFEPMLQAKRERLSAESYAKGPQLDAAAEAQRLKLALNPTDIENSISARAYSAAAGPRGPEALAAANRPRVNEIAKNELGLDPSASLTSPAPFKQARANLAGPYDDVSKLPTLTADEATIANLNGLRKNEKLIGGEGVAKKVDKLVDDAIAKTQAGLNGAELLNNVRTLRADAKKIYNNQSATPKQLSIADANLAIANQLESMIDSNISNPKLLGEWRDARQKMARTYAYESATNFNTGMVDVSKLARLTSKDNALTGDIASLGKIAGNFPEVFTTEPTSKFFSAPRLTRSGVPGGAGALIGSQFGLTGSILGGLAGGAVGEFGGAIAANRLASPAYQAGLKLQDFRIPINQMAVAAAPIPQNRAVVPFDPRNALVQPTDVVGYAPDGTPITAEQAFSRPNFVPGRPEAQVNVGTQYAPNQLPAPSAESTLGAVAAERARRYNMEKTLQEQVFPAREQAVAQGIAGTPMERMAVNVSRAKSSSGSVIDVDPVTGKMTLGAEGTAKMTPNVQVIESTGKSLDSAIKKLTGTFVETTPSEFAQFIDLSTGKPIVLQRPKPAVTTRTGPQAFNLTSEERIAWNKTKADLAAAAPDLKGLSDKAIANKIMDREWVSKALAKAREEAQAFDAIAQRGATDLARRAAAKERDIRIDALNTLEEQLRAPRPTSLGGQGPKTRAAIRNKLAPQDTGNAQFNFLSPE